MEFFYLSASGTLNKVAIAQELIKMATGDENHYFILPYRGTGGYEVIPEPDQLSDKDGNWPNVYCPVRRKRSEVCCGRFPGVERPRAIGLVQFSILLVTNWSPVPSVQDHDHCCRRRQCLPMLHSQYPVQTTGNGDRSISHPFGWPTNNTGFRAPHTRRSCCAAPEVRLIKCVMFRSV